MAKVVRRTKHHKKTKLYARIMLWLSLPLFVLGAIFTAIQLTNQINALNQIHRVQSEFAFQGVQKTLGPIIQNPDSFESLPLLKKSIGKIRALYNVGEIALYSVLDNKPLLTSDSEIWGPADKEAIEEILFYNKQQGKLSLSLKIDKQVKQLIAYIPLTGPEEGSLYIARVYFPLSDIVTAISTSRWTLGTMLFFIAFIGIIIAQGLARSIVRPISILNQATLEIMHGNLDQHITINTGDEIEGLAERFNQMRHALKEMQRKAQDANPLTGLPGNTGIYHELQKRITERQKFVLFHCDLDRFKVFNDHFGLAQGDKAIKKTAEFLRKMVKEKGAPDDFIGHQGGDDFVVITRPHRAKELAESVCQYFKTGVTLHLYSKEEYDKGFTMQLDRRRQTETGETVMVPFPLLSVSMAGISNSKQDFADYADCMARVAPIKKEVKKIVESNFLIVE